MRCSSSVLQAVQIRKEHGLNMMNGSLYKDRQIYAMIFNDDQIFFLNLYLTKIMKSREMSQNITEARAHQLLLVGHRMSWLSPETPGHPTLTSGGHLDGVAIAVQPAADEILDWNETCKISNQGRSVVSLIQQV